MLSLSGGGRRGAALGLLVLMVGFHGLTVKLYLTIIKGVVKISVGVVADVLFVNMHEVCA